MLAAHLTETFITARSTKVVNVDFAMLELQHRCAHRLHERPVVRDNHR